ncbi:mechanosensitive ion channel domain-containing protein [Sphingomonas sp. CROZ-RG-20F-R02-07]|uniref:mechanosensitive ion channel family protein n=1 Tax=Sphingomonas sp. CROZ-RG-20F-R02-07 TaxID=2914832 RepID=UPI001F5A89D0|nr:mechanosensitive ion channel domain-containing protein [Sphingomonas sp. CROZ-RG-20F-R02-07]
MPNSSAAAARHTPLIQPVDVKGQIESLFAASAAWLHTNWLQILIAIGAGTAIVFALHVLRRLGNRLCAQDRRLAGWGSVFGRAVVRTNNFFIVMLAAKLVAGYAATPGEVNTTINFLWTVASVFQAAIWAREIILGAIEHRTKSEHYSGEALLSAMGLIRLLVTFALFAIAFIVVLDNLGVNVTGLVAGLGVGGIAIGLAAQGIFADLFAALAIIFDRPFRRGDAITYDKSSGTVEAIGLKSTRIRAPTGEERIISNKHLLDKEILNNTKREYRRITFTLGLVQWSSIDTMERLPALVKEVVEACGAKFVRAGFAAFGDSSYDFGVEFDSPSAAYQDYYDMRHKVGVALVRRLNDDGIELAYPTQTGFTARPEGGLIMPYASLEPLSRAVAQTPAPTAPLPPSTDRSAVDQDGGEGTSNLE